MHVSEGPGIIPEISSKANPQFKFSRDFLLNPGKNPVASQEPYGQISIKFCFNRVSVTLKSLDLVSHIMSVSRQCQLSNVSHENVTQIPNPFNTICKVWAITPHGARKQFGMGRLLPSHSFTITTLMHEFSSSSLRNPLQPLACLHARTAPPSPPASLLMLPHPCRSQSLCSRSALNPP
ncbi:hypothetical protein O181_107678 [Austropuccinia psidii MF-1]|uniref:Uncharacterized protein n=1 Tax=Austropuccinia psidii MF-1 TaxID=1389203 RepID=A0A9Q3PN45_9BASI|nr:hypothetical protein [Austropuccinia psidii MF-1]